MSPSVVMLSYRHNRSFYRSSDSLDSVNSVRMRELQKRNTMYPPHLRSAYPLEVSSRFSERDIHEDEFRNSENFVPPPSHGKHKVGYFFSFPIVMTL